MMKNERKIIAFVGPIGAGKTTASDHLVRGFEYDKYPFAGPLKSMLRNMGLAQAELYGDEKETPNNKLLGGKTPRHAMQTLGTEWGRRMIHEDIWVDVWKHKIGSNPTANIVVDDCRFPNEIAAIRELGGKFIWVVRNDTNVKIEHESESHLRDLFLQSDHRIYNDKDKQHLRLQINYCMNAINKL